MFKLFFWRAEPTRPPRKPSAAVAPPRPPARRAPLINEPPPLPEVREDHDESAWDLWEQSQFQLDSQMGGLSPADSVRVREGRPSQMDDLDPFQRIGKNHR